MISSTQQIAFITGANRGIGKEISKKLSTLNIHTILGIRDLTLGHSALLDLQNQVPTGSFELVQIDLENETSIQNAISKILTSHGRIDILVNNAGILKNPDATIMDVAVDEILCHIRVNALGPMRVTQLVLPNMIKNNYGRIVNISSISGSIGNLLGEQLYRPFPESDYRISKATLNMVTALFEDYIRPKGTEPRLNVLINAACPGWASTRMGGESAEITPEEAADTPVWLATLPENGPSGKFFRYRKELAW